MSDDIGPTPIEPVEMTEEQQAARQAHLEHMQAIADLVASDQFAYVRDTIQPLVAQYQGDQFGYPHVMGVATLMTNLAIWVSNETR